MNEKKLFDLFFQQNFIQIPKQSFPEYLTFEEKSLKVNLNEALQWKISEKMHNLQT